MRSVLALLKYSLKYYAAITIPILMLVFTSCKKESTSSALNNIPAGQQLLSTGYAPGAATKVCIYATAAPYVGYNKLSIGLYDSASNAPISQSQVTLSASSNNLTGPTENPGIATNGIFTGAATFLNAGNWMLSAHIQNTATGRAGIFSAPVSIVQATPARSYSLTTADSSNLFVSMVQPVNAQLGINTFELVVYKQKGLSDYSPDSTYMLDINPTMPSMTGMSSPNNVNPSYAGNGHYTGKVDFIMTGDWWIYVDLMHNGTVADASHYFDISPSY